MGTGGPMAWPRAVSASVQPPASGHCEVNNDERNGCWSEAISASAAASASAPVTCRARHNNTREVHILE